QARRRVVLALAGDQDHLAAVLVLFGRVAIAQAQLAAGDARLPLLLLTLLQDLLQLLDRVLVLLRVEDASHLVLLGGLAVVAGVLLRLEAVQVRRTHALQDDVAIGLDDDGGLVGHLPISPIYLVESVVVFVFKAVDGAITVIRIPLVGFERDDGATGRFLPEVFEGRSLVLREQRLGLIG